MSQTGMKDKNLQFVLNLLSHCPLKCQYELRKPDSLDASLLEDVRTERMLFKYHIKICSKNNYKQTLSSLKIMNKNTPQQTQ